MMKGFILWSALAHLVSSSSFPRRPSIMDCTALSAKLPGRVFFPGSPEYTKSVGSYFSAFEDELSPSCVVQPESAKDVAAVIKSVKTSDTPIAIRSGGHTTWAGAANIDKGITIDLSTLKGVKYDDKTSRASIMAGERWGNVYSTLGTKGLAIAGGRVSKVGVGGLTTGGGLSHFSAAVGLVCDNVVNYQVVLACGSIVEVNQNSHPDLFIALKGGTNNFGVVTRFDFPTFPVDQFWGGTLYYNASAYPQLMQAFHDFTLDLTPDEHAHIIMAISWFNGSETAVANPYYTLPVAEPQALQGFTKAEPQIFSSLRFDSLLGMTEEQAGFSTNGARQWFFTTSFRADVDFMHEVYAIWQQGIKPTKGVPGFTVALVYQPIIQRVLDHSASKGGNSLGLTPDDGPFLICLINSVHDNPSDDDLVSQTMLNIISRIDELAKKRGKDVPYRFMNYGFKGQPIIKSYGEASVQNLWKVSKKYDPDAFFQVKVPGGFKLPKV